MERLRKKKLKICAIKIAKTSNKTYHVVVAWSHERGMKQTCTLLTLLTETLPHVNQILAANEEERIGGRRFVVLSDWLRLIGGGEGAN